MYTRGVIGFAFASLHQLSPLADSIYEKAKAKIVKDVTQLVLARRTRMCNFLEYKGASSSRCLGAGRAGEHWASELIPPGIPVQIRRSCTDDTRRSSSSAESARETMSSSRWR